MKCFSCGLGEDLVELFEGIASSGIVSVCKKCADNEYIPIIRKPSDNQLEQANKSFSVRERMENMSSSRRFESSEVSKDQSILQKNLSRLRVPPKKEIHEEVIEDYPWEINMARRRKKLSIKQVSEKVGISPEILESIERGKIPKDFEEVFGKLEKFYGIKLLRLKYEKVKFTRKKEDEQRILREVGEKMKTVEERNENLNRISKGDLSKIKDLSKITISDLQELKRKKEEREKELKKKEMIDDDFELELEEV